MAGHRQSRRRGLFSLASTQAGHFTAAQALALGYTYQAQKYHVEQGNWLRVDRGIFRLAEWPSGLHDDLVRWHLWSKQRAVASHETAAAAHGLGVYNPSKIHLSVPPEFRMNAGALVLHRRHLPRGDITKLDGAPVTTVLRTILDLFEEHSDEESLEEAVADALATGAVTPLRIRRRLDELSGMAHERAERVLRSVEHRPS